MKGTFIALSLVAAGTLGSAAWAGPLEDVAAFGAPRAKAFSAGDVAGWTDAYTENASWYPQFSPFRIDG